MYKAELKNLCWSLVAAQANPGMIVRGHCYENIFRLVTDGGVLDGRPSWRIAFGLHGVYVPDYLAKEWDIAPGAYYSTHMFLYDLGDKENPIIDPTVPIDNNDNSYRLGYYVAATLSREDYLKALLDGKYYDVDCNPHFDKHMQPLLAWCAENGVRVYDPVQKREP